MKLYVTCPNWIFKTKEHSCIDCHHGYTEIYNVYPKEKTPNEKNKILSNDVMHLTLENERLVKSVKSISAQKMELEQEIFEVKLTFLGMMLSIISVVKSGNTEMIENMLSFIKTKSDELLKKI